MPVLAIDIGPTTVTATAVSARGSVVVSGHQGFAQHVPHPGWLEHVPEEIWRATLAATRTVLAEVDASELTSIEITNQGGTIALWDCETLGSPRRAIASQDRRAVEVCARMRAEGHEDRVGRLTGLRLEPAFSATKLLWLAEHEPHTWALVRSGRYAVGTLDSYLITRMTRGTWHVTDLSNASHTLLLDREAGDWSDELCELFDVPRDALADLVPGRGDIAPTEPSVFLGLALPINSITAHP